MVIRMTLHIEDTVGAQIEVLEDGTTIADIMYALNWVKKEKTRQAGKYQRYYKPIRDEQRRARLESSSPTPVEDKPKRPRGRPRKDSPAV
jgi:hypothetical protein